MTDHATGIAWRPGAAEIERSRLLRFVRSMGCASYEELQQRATTDPGWYWQGVERDLGIRWTRPYDRPIDLTKGKAFAEFYVGGRMNYIASAITQQVENRPDADAVIWETEEGATGRWSYRELGANVARAANALRAQGIGMGDRVGIFMPLTPVCAVATLACSWIGAIFTPIFSGYGAEAVASRLRDARVSALITADGFFRRGRLIDMKSVADEAARLADVPIVIVERRTGSSVQWNQARDVWWHDIVDGQPTTSPLADTSAQDPYMLIYTSGTTGRPKGAVHIHGGFPIKAAHDLAYCFDIGASDRVFWYSDIGWMMAPWLIAGTLVLGGAMVLYDGAIDFPEPDRIWAIVERQRATLLGISPTAVRALMRQPLDFVQKHELTSLRVLGSSGETWNEDPWWWFFREVGAGRCPIINYSGGTEIGGGIVSGLTIAPSAPCGFAGPTPGMAADVVDADGQPVRGDVGELIVRQPWVGMTRGFWGDNERYLETYWSRWPDIWVHGDWARIDSDQWYIQGRSDDTIKVAGKRLGPAEVESAAVGHSSVLEAVGIGVPDELKGESLVVFVVLRPGIEPSEELRVSVSNQIVAVLGPTLRPSTVRFASEIPKTRNAKILRRVVRGAHLGLADLGDLSALENQGAVAAIRSAE